MYLQLIFSSVLIYLINAVEHHGTKNAIENKAIVDPIGKTITANPFNLTYIEKGENLIRVPAMSKYSETKKKKTIKKSPKRTIQKIIGSRKSKMKKLYVVRMTSSHPTVVPKHEYNDRDKNSQNAEMTTRPNEKKIKKKFSVKQVKLPRYPLPYHSMQLRKNNYIRPKRETPDVFILQDFDSMKFLKEKKDYDVVNAHFKKYW